MLNNGNRLHGDRKKNTEKKKRHENDSGGSCRKADLSDTNISHIERGATKLSLPSLIAITNALNTTTDRLLMDVTDSSAPEFKKEFAALINDCNTDEYRLLYNTCDAILKTLRKK